MVTKKSIRGRSERKAHEKQGKKKCEVKEREVRKGIKHPRDSFFFFFYSQNN